MGLLLEAASFLVLPSHREGLSNVLLEAMASGCPIVASDVPGNREAVTQGEEGLLYGSADGKALTLAMHRMLTDAPLRQRLARKGLERARREFSLDSMVRTMGSIYLGCARAFNAVG